MANEKNIISISNTFTLKGFWFLPDNPKRTVAGILYYTPSSKPRLELIGGFDEEPDFFQRILIIIILILSQSINNKDSLFKRFGCCNISTSYSINLLCIKDFRIEQ